MQMGKKWDEVHRVYNKDVNVSELCSFSSTQSQFWTFSESLLQSNTMGSEKTEMS